MQRRYYKISEYHSTHLADNFFRYKEIVNLDQTDILLLANDCAIYPILFSASASTASHKILIYFIVAPFSDF